MTSPRAAGHTGPATLPTVSDSPAGNDAQTSGVQGSTWSHAVRSLSRRTVMAAWPREVIKKAFTSGGSPPHTGLHPPA